MKKLIVILVENIEKNFGKEMAIEFLIDIYENNFDQLDMEDRELLKQKLDELGA